MANFVIDSNAWIEYFRGSKKGKKVQRYLERKGTTVLTTDLIVAEVCINALRMTGSADRQEAALKSMTVMATPEIDTGAEAARLYLSQRKKRPKFGTADALILSAARSAGATLVTCDNDFAGLNGVRVIR